MTCIEQLLEAAEVTGWLVELTKRRSHFRLYTPDGDRVAVIPSRGSNPRTLRSIRATLKRAGILDGPIERSEGVQDDARLDEPTRSALASFRAASDDLLQAVAEDPALMLQLHWRKFEELVAALLKNDGFDVELTPPSGDRGVDIYARRSEPLGPVLYVVECKRFCPDRRIGPHLVRGLYGVVERERATRGILATTSFFTPGARVEANGDLAYRLSLRDGKDMGDWIRATRASVD